MCLLPNENGPANNSTVEDYGRSFARKFERLELDHNQDSNA
jgi:hypothetical protein